MTCLELPNNVLTVVSLFTAQQIFSTTDAMIVGRGQNQRVAYSKVQIMPPVVNKQTARKSPLLQNQTQNRASPSKAMKGRSAWDVTDKIKMLLYGRSGTGKTTLWATFPKPILAIICSGGKNPGELKSINTPEYRKTITPRIVDSTSDIKELIEDSENYATVVLDHCSGLQDLTLKEILNLDELPAQKSWGLATQQEYGQSSLMCKEIFRKFLDLPTHVVLVSQERTFGAEGESEVIAPTVGAALTPSVTGWLNPACDYVVQAFIRPKMEKVTRNIQGKDIISERRVRGVEYCLRTEPHDTFMTKFRVPMGYTVPDVIVNPTFEIIQAITNGEFENKSE